MTKPARLTFAFLSLFVAANCSKAAGPGAAPASGSPTAYAAIRVARKALGSDALAHLVEVSGRDGVPQPDLWKIVLKDRDGGLREIEVTGGKISARHTLEPAASPRTIKLAALNLDSSGAFDAADLQARKVHVRFDSINYVLKADRTTGKPSWTLELFTREGSSVGTMRVTATDGTIASIDGRLAVGPGRPGQPLTASNAATASTTATVQTTAAPPPPPAVHDVDSPPVHEVDAPQAAPDDEQGGYFTRAGRAVDRANDKVQMDLRKAKAKVQRFFTGHSDMDSDSNE